MRPRAVLQFLLLLVTVYDNTRFALSETNTHTHYTYIIQSPQTAVPIYVCDGERPTNTHIVTRATTLDRAHTSDLPH